MKKLFIFLLLGILLVGTLGFFLLKNKSIQEEVSIPLKVIDPITQNVMKEILLKNLTYENNDLDAIFNGQNEDNVLRFNLKSHPSVDYIKQVRLGNQIVIWYDINSVYQLENALGNPEFIDMRTGKVIERDWKYVMWKNIERDIYDWDCSGISLNGSEECNLVVIGKETYETWLPYNSKDIPKGQITIGVMVNVQIDETTDVIWAIGGKKISKHAIYTSGAVITYVMDGGLNYTIFTYLNDGTFNTTENLTAEVLVVAGGGGGGAGWGGGGGGGAGGLVHNQTSFIASGNYSVIIGDGGIGVDHDLGTDGSNSSFNNIIAIGGGGGGQASLGRDGGSGGGGGSVNGPFVGGSSIQTNIGGTGYGNSGGAGVNSPDYGAGGGGGAGAVGEDGTTIIGGDGGIGKNYTINGTNVYYAGGGGGGSAGVGGLGGGGSAGVDDDPGFNGTANTGGGGGGGFGLYKQGGDGGSGIVIIKYLPQGITISLINPTNNQNLTINNIDFSANTLDVGVVGIQNVSLKVVYPNGTLFYNETNTSGFEGIYNWTNINILDGNWNWSVNAFDDADTIYESDMWVFSIDTIFPQINISHPIDGQNFPYLINLNNITLNTTITDTNLDTCWYEYNSTNTTFSCTSGVLSEINLTINNESVVIVWANDTLEQENSSTSDWNYDLFDFNNYTFDATITESSLTTFIGNFQTGTVLSSTFLEYNNTNYSVSIDSLGGNRYTLTSIITSPSISSDTNITWFFWVNNINATSQNQTVQNINLDNCSSYNNYIVNYTLVDELTQTEINNSNSSIESLIYLRTISGETIAQFNETFTGDSTPTVCSEIQLNETGLRFWEQSRYGSDDYVFEQHNIQNATMTSLPAEITLRDLPSISATTFRITYKSETFLAVPDAVINIQRKYIGEGIFKSIESPITDANGEVSASLDLDAVIYRIIVSENGITLSTFENPAIACDNILTGDCTININERQTINLINTFDVINDFNYGLTQDNRTITLTFEIPSGASKNVNLFVNQSTILGNKTSCNQTSLATSGQIQCVIEPTLGDVFATIEVSSGGTQITTASTTILEDRSQYFGTDNIVLTFFLVLSLVLLMISDPIAVLIGIVIGLISGGLMLFLNMGSLFGVTSILMYLIIIIIIIIIKVSNRQR